ncbi:MAG: GNAT family N-acetyltransferase [Steroidobacteraceae bacterium]
MTFDILPLARLDTATRAEWTALSNRLGANPTLQPGWVDVVHNALGNQNEAVQVLLGTSTGELQVVLPFFMRRSRLFGVPMRMLELASNRVAYHAQFLTAGNREAVLQALLERAPTWDVFYAAGLIDDSADTSALRAMGTRLAVPLVSARGERSPFLRIDGSWEQFLASQNKKFRYKVKRRREDHVKDPAWRTRWFENDTSTDELLHDMLAIEQSSWKASAGTDIASRDFELRYHRELLPFLSDAGMLSAVVLYRGAEPVAYSLCCRSGSWFGHLKTSFNSDFSTTSPGAFVIDLSVQKAFETGAGEFDFLGDAAPHKLAWSDTVRAHENLWLYAPRILPRLIGRAKLARQTPQ